MTTRPSIDQIHASYIALGNVWKVGEALGVTGQWVHCQLAKHGLNKKINSLTEQEKQKIEELYRRGFLRGDGQFKALCKEMGRAAIVVQRHARKLGLTTMHRPMHEDLREHYSKVHKETIARNGHPRGSLGMKHTKENKEKFSKLSKDRWAGMTKDQQSELVMKSLKTRRENGSMSNPRKASWKQSWQEVGGKRFFARSSWEANYAIVLQNWKIAGYITDWEHEPDTFWFEKIKRGVRSYTPDFRLTYPCGKIEYHEIKGWMDDRSKTKLKRMRIYYPKIIVVLIEAKAYKAAIKEHAID